MSSVNAEALNHAYLETPGYDSIKDKKNGGSSFSLGRLLLTRRQQTIIFHSNVSI